MKKWILLLLAVVLALGLGACATSTDSGEGDNPKQTEDGKKDKKEGDKDDKGEKVLRLNNGTEPKSLDPSIGFDSVSWTPLNNLMEGLTRLDENSQPQAATAETWDISEDGKTYTFYIREDAKWSNGDPVVAEDFVYAWKYMLDPDTASPAAFLAYFIEGAEEYNSGDGSVDDVKVSAKDEKTLEVVLTAPTGFF